MSCSTKMYGKWRNPSNSSMGCTPLGATPPHLTQAENLYENKIPFHYKNLCSTCKITHKNLCFKYS